MSFTNKSWGNSWVKKSILYCETIYYWRLLTSYEYFPSKYDVIEQTLVKLAIGVLKRHEELVANESMTFEEKLNAYFSTNPVTNKVFSMRKAKQIFTKVPKICDVLESYAVQDWKLL